ncbi:MAG: FAD-dependent oxidoreductase [Candidatus Eisenbacteria bacterium]|nr:FAD-dependent oxidoreductase [Candidatus Eisenbacteria bacterium]
MEDREHPTGLLPEAGRTYAPHEAVIEASRCLMCEDPPCNRGCPAGVDVRRFVRKIRFGNFRGATRLIRDANPLVGVCGRVCPQEILCMEHCTRGELDTPIDIAGLQRFAGDIELGALAPLPGGIRERPERVAVVGAGPAGLAAAVALRLGGFQVEVFERERVAGGVLALGVPPTRLSRAFLESELAYVTRLGVKVHLGDEQDDPASLLSKGFAAVFVAPGLWKARRVGIPGSDLQGVHVAMEFLKAVARGERPAIGARVVVIGGGNVAMDAATTAKALGAERVDLCCLESFDEMPAFRSEIEHAQAEGVEFRTRTRPVRVVGEGGRVAGYEGIGIRWKVPGLLVPSNAEDVPGTEFGLRADAVIEAIGQGPLDGFAGLATDTRGLVAVDVEAMTTSVEGVFAGGDVTSGGATVVQAVAEGKRAAAAIAKYLESRREKGGRR